MKKTLRIVLILLFVIPFVGTAQESRYGLRLGANLSWISSDEITGDLDESRIGVAAGFFAEYFFTQKLSIQPELQYSSQGNKDKTLRINYLQLPVVLKYSVFREIINVQLGPQVGLNIWQWEEGEQKADFSTFDFAAVAGISVNITDNFFATLRYAHGLSNVFDDSDSPITLDGNNRNVQLSVGYRL